MIRVTSQGHSNVGPQADAIQDMVHNFLNAGILHIWVEEISADLTRVKLVNIMHPREEVVYESKDSYEIGHVALWYAGTFGRCSEQVKDLLRQHQEAVNRLTERERLVST